MSDLKVSSRIGTIVASAAIALLAMVIVDFTVKDSVETGVYTLPVQMATAAEIIPMFSPVDSPKAVRAIVDQSGKCLWVLTRDGNQRACEDSPNWKNLPTEVDKGQFFRGTSLD